MMRDLPCGAELLAEARCVLTDAVLPSLAPDSRYQALMIIRAMDLAERELRANPALESNLGDQLCRLVATQGTVPELFNVLSKRLRTGAFDASEELYELLRLVVAFKLRESNPSIVPEALEDSLDQLLRIGTEFSCVPGRTPSP